MGMFVVMTMMLMNYDDGDYDDDYDSDDETLVNCDDGDGDDDVCDSR